MARLPQDNVTAQKLLEDGYALSQDGEKALCKTGKTFRIIDVESADVNSGKDTDGELDLTGMRATDDILAEWTAMFHEAWRLERDYFYAPTMNDVDWEEMGRRYEVLLPHASTESRMFKAQIRITLKPTVLDAQGATVERALHNLGYESADQVRMGKYVELLVNSGDEAAARRQVDEMCQKLLVNPTIEEYRFELVAAQEER